MKSLLVHMDGTPRCKLRLGIAAELAQRHQAHLTALFAATPPLNDPIYPYAPEAASLEVLRELYVGWRDKALTDFRGAGLGPQASWAELGLQPVITGFARQARFADLIVLGQHDPADVEREVPGDFVPSVVVDSGRAALVVPFAGKFATRGTRALVAWKPSAASARALAAALPLLRLAREVTVIEWAAAPAESDLEPLDVERYLSLNGVTARVQRHAEDPKELGELLLSRAADLQAALLVLGCYGHSRAREFVLGGVTRTVLASMTRPVLMSH